MKLKLAGKIDSKEALEEAINELRGVCYTSGYLEEALRWAKRKFTLEQEALCNITDNNFWHIREGLRLQLIFILRAGTQAPQFTLELLANLSNTEIKSEYRFLLPTETSSHLRNFHRDDIFRRFRDEYFIRVSNEDPKMVSCFLNEKMARADRRTKLKPGRMMTKVLGYTDNEAVKRLVSLYEEETKPEVLKIAYSKEEIIRVYENGPQSCMCRKGWGDNNHPVQIYDHPHLCVAYLNKKGRPGEINARAVIRTDKENPEYIRMYGDELKLSQVLGSLGIKQSSTGLEDIKLQAIYRSNHRNKIIMPYLDGGRLSIIADRDELTIVGAQRAQREKPSAYVNADGTSGLVDHPDLIRCYSTQEWTWRDELFRVQRAHDTDYDYYFSMAGLLSGEYELGELHCKSGVQLWMASALGGSGTVKLNGKFYKESDLNYFGYILINNEYVRKNDPRVSKCVYSGILGLKENMIKVDNNYYVRLPPDISSTRYFNPKTGNLLKKKRKDMKTLMQIKTELVDLYATPLYIAEIQVSYPKASTFMAQAIINM